MEYTQKDAMMGKPLSVYIGDAEKEIPILSISATNTWLAYTDQVTLAEREVSLAKEEDGPKAREKFVEAMVNAIVNYCPSEITKDEIMEKGTVAQIIEIYQLLVEVTDPFQYSQKCSMQRTRDYLKGIPMTKGLMDHGMSILQKRS